MRTLLCCLILACGLVWMGCEPPTESAAPEASSASEAEAALSPSPASDPDSESAPHDSPEFEAWLRERFDPEILDRINSHVIRLEGEGTSYEEPVVVLGAGGSFDGVPAEYYWLCRKFGREGEDWERRGQSLTEKNGRHYDVVTIRVDGKWSSKKFYFDISDFYGKLFGMSLEEMMNPDSSGESEQAPGG